MIKSTIQPGHEPENDFPMLMVDEDGDVVLVSYKDPHNGYCGAFLSGHGAGARFSGLYIDNYKPFTGTITLQNGGGEDE